METVMLAPLQVGKNSQQQSRTLQAAKNGSKSGKRRSQNNPD